MPPHRELAPHERVFYRDKIRRLRGQNPEEDVCFAVVQSVLVGAVASAVLFAVGAALTQ
jgi:hypothetical protein